MKKFIKEWHGVINDFMIIVALIIGSIWALFEFYITTTPAIVISSTCKSVIQSDERSLIRLKISLENKGSGSKKYKEKSFLKIALNNLQPEKKSLLEIDNGGFNFSSFSNSGENFDLIGEAKYNFTREITIEPGDSESYYFNFLVSKNINYLSVYASTRYENGEILEKGVYTVCSAKGENQIFGMYEAEKPDYNIDIQNNYRQQRSNQQQQQQK